MPVHGHDSLDCLDNRVVFNPGCFFTDPEHWHYYAASSRLSLFADYTNQAIDFG